MQSREREKKKRPPGQTEPLFTPVGVPTSVEAEAYLSWLHRGHSEGTAATAGLDDITVASARIVRLEMMQGVDHRALQRALLDLSAAGPFAVVLNRISGAELQRRLGHSLPQQERSNVVAALRCGERRLLVVSETSTAKPGRVRPAFSALVAATERGQVSGWYASSPDRLTRWPTDGCRLVEAMQATGTVLRLGGGTGGPFEAVATDPMQALLLMIQFTMNAMHVIMISAGIRRVWRDRLAKGQWADKSQLLIGMELDAHGRPFYREESKQVVRRILELVASGAAPGDVGAIVRREFPSWCGDFESTRSTEVGTRRGTPLTADRVRRLLTMTVLADGRQVWRFRQEEVAVTYESLKGVVAHDLIARAATVGLARARRRGPRTNPWERLLQHLLVEQELDMATLIAASKGNIRWTTSGGWEFDCPVCSGRKRPDSRRRDVESKEALGSNDEDEDDAAEGHGPTRGAFEVDPDPQRVQLVDGRVLEAFPIPRLQCAVCGTTAWPLGREALEWLLAGYRPVRCPFCPEPLVSIRRRRLWDYFYLEAVDGLSSLEAECPRCKACFPVPPRMFPHREHSRLLRPARRRAQRGATRTHSADIRSYLGTGEEPQREEEGEATG